MSLVYAVQKLDLSLNQIGDKGLEAFATACASGSLAHLEKLVLSRNLIGVAGLEALANTFAMGSLAQLKVSSLPTALLPWSETWHAHSSDL